MIGHNTRDYYTTDKLYDFLLARMDSEGVNALFIKELAESGLKGVIILKERGYL